MTPADYARVKAVFAAAIELPEPQRAEFVERKCASDNDTLGEVLSLLRHHRDDTILDSPPRRDIAITPDARVDPYLVLSDVWEDCRQVLRRRLVVIASVLAVLIAVSTLRLVTYHHAE